jgi:alcohol dehydrogenase class IV
MLAGISADIAGGSHLNHAIEHGFSGLNPELPHGAGLAMFGPMIVYYTHRAVPEISARLLRNLDPSIKPTSEDAEKAKRVVEEFQETHGFSERLSDYGIRGEDIERTVDFIMKTISERYHVLIPFPTSRELVLNIVRSVL